MRRAQGFWQRLANVGFYYGSLAAEQLRALPLYERLGAAHNVDCLSLPVAHGSTMFLYNMVRAAGNQGFRGFGSAAQSSACVRAAL
jgi:hypothetical protein